MGIGSEASLKEAKPVPPGTYQVALGGSFRKQGGAPSYHTFRYNFKPKSATSMQSGRLNLQGRAARLTMHTDGVDPMLFEGNVEPHKTNELVLICDAQGQWRLERLSQNIRNLSHRA